MADHHFKPGNPGKPKGATNHLTRTVKETVLLVFNKLQEGEDNNLEKFAEKYPRDFYNIAAKLIPTEVQAKITQVPNTYQFENDAGCKDIQD